MRHGRTADNAAGRIQGQRDVALDEVGRAQVLAAAAAMVDAAPTAIWSSDLSRAMDTAQAVGERAGLPVQVDRRLRELALGSWEGLTGPEARLRFPAEHRAWVAGEDVPRGGGETYLAAGERAAACLREAAGNLPAGSTVVAVTHGGTARGALGCLLELEAEVWWRLSPLGNACWSVLVEADRGWRLERHNCGVGAPVAAAVGAHELGGRAVTGPTSSPDAEPVK